MRFKMLRSFKKFLKTENGTSGIEFAFIMPVMAFMYFGLIDATGLISVNRKITASASITADLVSQEKTSMLKSKITDQFIATEIIMAPTAIANVRVEVFGYRNKASPTKIWHSDNGNGPSCGADPDTTTMPALMQADNDLIIARACTNYTPLMSSWYKSWTLNSWGTVMGSASFLVSQTIIVRPRTGTQITCYQTSIGGTVCS
jgi:Flp pilus assembly protein TadG